MSTEIRRLIQAIRDAVDYMDIDDACNELEALLLSPPGVSPRPSTKEVAKALEPFPEAQKDDA